MGFHSLVRARLLSPGLRVCARLLSPGPACLDGGESSHRFWEEKGAVARAPAAAPACPTHTGRETEPWGQTDPNLPVSPWSICPGRLLSCSRDPGAFFLCLLDPRFVGID